MPKKFTCQSSQPKVDPNLDVLWTTQRGSQRSTATALLEGVSVVTASSNELLGVRTDALKKTTCIRMCLIYEETVPGRDNYITSAGECLYVE